jgi:hypothetical protein
MALLRNSAAALRIMNPMGRFTRAFAGNPFAEAEKGAEDVYFNQTERVRALGLPTACRLATGMFRAAA